MLMGHDRREMTGITASQGFAMGPLWIAGAPQVGIYVPKGSLQREALALRDAIQKATGELAELHKPATGSAADILEFQSAMLADDTFYDAALNRIGSGENASEAWQYVLGKEIEAYKDSTDDVFHARAIDLEDIQFRVLRALYDQPAQSIPHGVIVLADNLTPTVFLAHDWKNGGLALTGGSTASHVAVLARQFSVPMVTNVSGSLSNLKADERTLLLAGIETGKLIASPTAADEQVATIEAFNKPFPFVRRQTLLTYKDKPIVLMINLAHLRELDQLDPNICDGIGLVRTEFLFEGAHLDEDRQFQAYCSILKWANGKPVFIRTFDEGGDKSFAGFANDGALSKRRGISLSLERPETFRVQIRALLRGAAFAPLNVTLPMVSCEAEFHQSLALFEDEAHRLAAAKIKYKMPEIGIMAEVPSVALTLERFGKAAHFAIGTNDLIQYALSEPRDAVSKRSGIEAPEIMALIKRIVAMGDMFGKPVSVCGDAASDTKAIAHLLGAGITRYSVNPPDIRSIANAIMACNDSTEA